MKFSFTAFLSSCTASISGMIPFYIMFIPLVIGLNAYQLCSQSAMVGDRVWEDLNGNGFQEAGEPGMEGVKVILHYNDGTQVAEIFTDAMGHYLFTGLPAGAYYLSFEAPGPEAEATRANAFEEGHDSDIDHSMGLNTTSVFVLYEDEQNMEMDAGFYYCALIKGMIWCDLDLDDLYDATEHGINGIEVVVFRKTGNDWIIWDQIVTAHHPGSSTEYGYWQTCAPPGLYYSAIQMPDAGLVLAFPDIGDDDTIDSDYYRTTIFGSGDTEVFQVLSGDLDHVYMAGYSYMATVQGVVWVDLEKNGQRDEDEERWPGIQVELFDENEAWLAETYTDENGFYQFEYLKAGIYAIKVNPPESYGFTFANYGDDETDSDVDEFLGPGMTSLYPVAMNHKKELDAGLINKSLALAPVNLSVYQRPDHNLLEWTFTCQCGADRIMVERSSGNSGNFIPLQEIRLEDDYSSAKFRYSDYDLSANSKQYYRLRLFTADGAEQFSEIRSVWRDEVKGSEILVYPVPAKDYLYVNLSLSEEEMCQIKVFDANGKIVHQEQFKAQNTGNTEHQIRLDRFRRGFYLLAVETSNGIFVNHILIAK